MRQFDSIRDAKEYIIGRILVQADRDGVVLSDVERKMLYFSETGWTLPDMMRISQEFDEAYDQDEYERKIGEIVRRIHDQPEGSRDDKSWSNAVVRLREEDHYLLVLIGPTSGIATKKKRWETARLILWSVVAAPVWICLSFFIFSHVKNAALSKLLNLGALMGIVFFVAWFATRERGQAD